MTRPILASVLTALVATVSAGSATAQAPPSRGFEVTAAATATVEELHGQRDLWVMEVDFKPLRLIQVAVTDPQTGEKRDELIWYLVYRATNLALKSPPEKPGMTPVNNLDAPPGPSLFVPSLTLFAEDQGRQTVLPDEIIPEAQAAIARREQRGEHANEKLLNSVDAVQPVPPAVPAGDRGAKPIYGVAMWRGVDPRATHFKVLASGFSNGFKRSTGPAGEPLILRRDLDVDFWRPGDEFALTEREFRFEGAPKWVYVPDETTPDIAAE